MKVATYNIGAKPDESFQGPGKAIFRAKLQEDIATMTGEGIHILCLQEVSSKWEGEIRKMLPTGWEILWADYCLTAFHGPSWQMLVDSSSMYIFQARQDGTSAFRRWRTCLRVSLEAKDGTKFMIVNLHVVSGVHKRKENGVTMENHKIPGKTPENREQFKRTCVTNTLEIMLQEAGMFEMYPGQKWPLGPTAPAASQGPTKIDTVLVLAGDFNLLPTSFDKAFEDAKEEIQAMSVVGLSSNKAGKRDWIICNKPIAAPDFAPVVIAHDSAHAAVFCEWSLMTNLAAAAAEAAEAPWPAMVLPAPIPVISARVAQKLIAMRARLFLRKATWQCEEAEKQRKEEEAQAVAEEEAQAVAEEAEKQRKEEEAQAVAEEHRPKRPRSAGEARTTSSEATAKSETKTM